MDYKLSNMDIRLTAKEYGVPLWEVADALGISEPTLTRKLRRELDAESKKTILNTIKTICLTKNAG